jgi:hypothetical protein
MKLKTYFPVVILLAASAAFSQEANSKIYIPPAAPEKTITDGTKVVTTSGGTFDYLLGAELMKNGVRLALTTDSQQAAYTARWGITQEPHYGGYDVYTASVSLVDAKGQIIWSGVTTKRTQRDCADAIAKQLKNAMKHKQ